MRINITKRNNEKRKKAISLVVAFAIFISTFSSALILPTYAAPISKVINYQGKLTTSAGVAVANGTYNMEFKLYDALTGGTTIWTETRTLVNKVQVTNGLFSIMLGEVHPFTTENFNQALYLGVKIESDAEMTPRKKLGVVPAAIEAEHATNATNLNVNEDVTTATPVYPTWVSAINGNLAQKTSSTKLSFIPSTGALTVTGSINSSTFDASSATAMTIGGTTQTGITLGRVGASTAINSNTWGITGAGAISGITTLGMSGQLTSTLATGTSPFAVTSTTLNTNLNADLLDGQHASDFATTSSLSGYVPYTGGTSNVDLGIHNLTVDTNTLFVNSATHNVGIGTTSPSGSLQIQKNSTNYSTEALKITGTALSNVTDGTSATEGYGLYLSYNVAGNRQFVFADTSTGAGVRYIGNSLDGFNKITQSRADLTLGTETNGAHVAGALSNTQFSVSNVGGTASKIVTEIKGAAAQSGNYLNVSSSSGTGDIMSVLSNGNVGIGTTAPISPLHIFNIGTPSLNYFGQLQVGDRWDGSKMFLSIGVNNTDDYSFIQSAKASNGVRNLALQGEGGNVGIGTTGPNYKLEVAGGTDNIALRVTGTGTGAQWTGRIVAGGTNNVFLMGEYNSMAWLGAHNAALNAWSDFYINPDGTTKLFLGAIGGFSGGPAMTVNNANGNVGIGTTTPGTKLDVVGGAIRTDNQFISTLATGTSPLSVTSTTLNTNLNADLLDGQHASDFATTSSLSGYVPYTGGTSNVDLGIHNLTVDTNTLFVNSATHNVGIGTTGPGYKLEVAGNSYFTDTMNLAAGKSFTFGNSGPGGTPGGFTWNLTNDTASMYASEVTADQTDYVFKMSDNATADRFVWWIQEWQGPAYDVYPMVLAGDYGNFYSGKLYINNTTGNVGIGTTGPSTKLQVSGGNFSLVGSVTPQINLTSSTGNDWNIISRNDGYFLMGRQGVRNDLYIDPSGDTHFSGSATTATQFISTLATGTAPLAVTSTTLNTNLNADLWDGAQLSTVTESLRANNNISGGGIITLDASSNLSWTNRFIIISNGNGSDFTTSGYYDITQPAATTAITGVGGAGSRTWTASGISLSSWEALYYILPIGSGNGSVAANFRVAAYTSALTVPHDWVLIAVNNPESGYVKVATGITLKAGQSYESASYTSSFVKNSDLLDGLHSSSFQTALTNPVTGTGTLNYIPKFTATGSTIGNSQIFDNGTNVGIGTVNPSNKFEVAGSNATLFEAAGFYNTYTYGDANKAESRINIGKIESGTTRQPMGSIGAFPKLNTDSSNGILTFYTRNTQAMVERMRIDEVGNVGIGATNPGEKLELLSTGGTAVGMKIGDGSGGLIIKKTGGYNQGVMNVFGNTTNYDGSSGGTSFSFRNRYGVGAEYEVFGMDYLGRSYFTGNVGIGTTGPGAKLTVSSTGTGLVGTAISTVFSTNAGGLGGTAGNELALGSIGFTTGNTVSLGVRGYRTSAGSDWTTTAVGLGMDVDNSVRAGGSLWFNSNGNVGIGTTTPVEKLSLPEGGNITIGDYGTPRGIFFRQQFSPNGWNNSADDIRNVSVMATLDALEVSGYSGVTINTNGNNARLKILNNGNVGVGTITPGDKLTVDGIVRTNVAAGGGYYAYDAVTGGSNLFSLTRQTNNLAISSFDGIGFTSGVSSPSTSYSMFIKNGGNVGIGTTAPTAKLSIVGAIGQRATIIGDAGLGSSFAGLSVQGTLTSTNYSLLGDGTYLFINRPTGGDIGFRENSVNQMIIKSGGNVGIGTTNPVSALHVGGTTGLTWSATGANSYGLTTIGTQGATGGSLFVNTPAYDNTWSSGFGVDGSYNGSNFISTINLKAFGVKFAGFSSNLAFSVTNGTSLNEAMRIIGNGNVGIGTTTPPEKLTIQGTWADTRLTGDNIILTKPNWSSGGWARNLLQFNEYTGSSLFQFGAYGSNNTFSYGYIGQAYNSPAITWNSTNNVGIGYTPSTSAALAVNGNVGIGTTVPYGNLTVASPATGNGVAYTAAINLTTQDEWGSDAVPKYMNMNFRGLAGDINGQIQVYNRDNTGWAAPMIFSTQNSSRVLTETMRITNGNVGIGTTAPSGKLNIVSTGVDNSGLTVQDNARKIKLGRDQIQVTDLSDVASSLYINPSGGSIYLPSGVWQTSGNVGIGTTAPTNPLTILSTSYSYPTLGTAAGQIALTGSGNLYGLYEGVNNGTGTSWLQSMRSDSAVAYPLLLNPVGGNVGIGTTTPNGKLDIATNGTNDGIVFYQSVDNSSSIQAYIDGTWATRSTYAGGCCNRLKLQPDVGEVQLGANLVVDYAGNMTGVGTISSGDITSNGGDNGFYNSGSAAWYMFDLGARGASAGSYGIGLTDTEANRQMSFHVPNQAAYGSTGVLPSFSWRSNGADELMKLTSATGDLWIKGSATLGGNLILGGNTITTTNTGVVANLNADMLDGYHANNLPYLPSSTTVLPNMGNGLNAEINRELKGDGIYTYSTYSGGTGGPSSYNRILSWGNSNSAIQISGDWVDGTSPLYVRSLRDCCSNWGNWNQIWTSSTDGAGSGLDADLWDGNEFATYLNQAVLTTSNPTFGTVYAALSGNATSATSATYLNSSNYINQTGSQGSWNADFQNTPAGTARYGGDVGANGTNGPGGTWWIQQDFRHTNASSYWGTQVAWGWEDNANRLATRNVQNGTFGDWVYYLNSSNVGTYALPISGGTMSNTNLVTNLNADLLDGLSSESYMRKLTGNTDYFNTGNLASIPWSGALPDGLSGVYNYGLSLQFNNNVGEANIQLYAPEQTGGLTGDLWYRTGWGTTKRSWAKIWSSINDGAGSGLDADTLDGLSSASFMSSVSDNWVNTTGDSMTGDLTFTNGRKGIVGAYDASQTQAIFSMGSSYVLPDGGASTNYGSFYGIGWSYNPDYGGAGNNPQSKAGLNHQALFMMNGITQTAIGTGIWTNGTITAPTITAGGTGTTWAALNTTNMLATGAIYSYNSICVNNDSGGCVAANGVVLGVDNNSAFTNFPSSGASFVGGALGIGKPIPVETLDVVGSIGLTGSLKFSTAGFDFEQVAGSVTVKKGADSIMVFDDL